MKRTIGILLAVLMVAVMAGCESRAGRKTEEAPVEQAQEQVSRFVNPIEDDPILPEADENADEEEEDRQAAEEAVQGLLDAMQTGNRDQIQGKIDYKNLMQLEEDEADANFLSLLKTMRYEIVEVDVQPAQATVTVDISNVNMAGGVLTGYLQQAMEMEFNNAISEAPKSYEEMEAAYQDLFVQTLSQNSSNTVRQTVDIQVLREGGNWVPQSSQALREAVFGGFFTARNQLGFDAG